MSIFIEAHLSNNRHSTCLLRGQHGLPQFCQAGKGFQDQQVCSPLQQCFNLFTENAAQFAQTLLVWRLERLAAWADSTRDKDGLACYLACFPCQANPSKIDLTDT